MAQEIKFDKKEAEALKNKLDQLNEETDVLLKDIGEDLERLKQTGSGDLINTLNDLSEGLKLNFNVVMKANKDVAEKLGDYISDFVNKMAEQVENLVGVKKKHVRR